MNTMNRMGGSSRRSQRFSRTLEVFDRHARNAIVHGDWDPRDEASEMFREHAIGWAERCRVLLKENEALKAENAELWEAIPDAEIAAREFRNR